MDQVPSLSNPQAAALSALPAFSPSNSAPLLNAPSGIDASGRSAQRFSVQVVARRGGVERQAAASGQDIYAVTGPMVAQAATRILAMNGRRKGSLSAGQLFEAREFLLALSPQALSPVLERDSMTQLHNEIPLLVGSRRIVVGRARQVLLARPSCLDRTLQLP
jgi:hypothetical protein